jgi:hypothetical protein
MKNLLKTFYLIILLTTVMACGKEGERIDVEKALRYQVEKESGGKLQLVSFKEISVKHDNPEEPTVHAVTYQAKVHSKENFRWGTSKENKLSRFVPYEAENNFAYQNREITKAGETRDVQHTIVFQKKNGEWVDQFGQAY